MADTIDTGLLPRTYFKAPRVPFDFRALALAMLGYLVYWGGSELLNEIFGKAHVVGSFLAAANFVFAGIPYVGPEVQNLFGQVFLGESLGKVVRSDYTFWHQLAGGVWLFAVWSFFGQAIHRITSLRIARDEGLSFGEAIAFAAKNWVTVALAPVIIALTIAFFYGCDALTGLLISIPWGGQILAILFVPLSMIASLLILLIALGGILGLPLIGAAAAWERNGTLDAISRAFSYIFARPLQFFWNYFLIFLFVGVILLVGSWFVYTLTKSIDAGVLSDDVSVMIDAPAQRNDDAWNSLSDEAKKSVATYREKTEYRPGLSAPRVEPFARSFQTVIHAPWKHKLNALIFWIAINLIWLGVFGYALYWFFGASTSVYADLRADVDGTEEDEIYIEEEMEDFDALAEAAAQASVDQASVDQASVDQASAEQAPADAAPEAKPDAAPDTTTETAPEPKPDTPEGDAPADEKPDTTA